MSELDEILKKLPRRWKKRIYKNSERFHDPEKAKQVLFTAYGKAVSINDSLIELGKRENVKYGNKSDKYVRGIYGLMTDRYHIETRFNNHSHLIIKCMDFSAEEQLKYYSLIFEQMPVPNTKSMETFSQSLYGMMQFPGIYMHRLFGSIRYDFVNKDKVWTPQDFEESFNRFINYRVGFKKTKYQSIEDKDDKVNSKAKVSIKPKN